MTSLNQHQTTAEQSNSSNSIMERSNLDKKILPIPIPNTKKNISFKSEHSFEKRKAEADRIIAKYPDRIPVIVERLEKSEIPDLDKKKYLVPSDLTIGQFVFIIRKRIKLSPDQAIFIFVNNTLPPASTLLSQIYKEHMDKDNFLYLYFSGESSFGWDN